MPLPRDDHELIQWIEDRFDEQDATTHRDWRRRVLGFTVGEAMSKISNHSTLSIRLPRAEMVRVRNFLRVRNMSVAQMIRMLIAGWMQREGEDPGPWLSQDGTL